MICLYIAAEEEGIAPLHLPSSVKCVMRKRTERMKQPQGQRTGLSIRLTKSFCFSTLETTVTIQKRQRESWHCCSSTIAWDHLVERDNIESLTKTAVRHTWPILDQCPRGQIEDYVQRHSWEKRPDLSLPSMIFLKDHKLNEKRRGLQIQARARAHNDVPSHSLSQKTHEICLWVSRALSPIWPVIQWKTHTIHTVKARAEQNGNDGKYGAR